MNKNKYWETTFLIAPAILFGNLSTLIPIENKMISAAVSAIFGLALGLFVFTLVRKKSSTLKSVLLLALLITPITILALTNNSNNDDCIIPEQGWIKNEIDQAIIYSHLELNNQTKEVPNSAKNVYSKLETHTSDVVNGKAIFFYNMETIEDLSKEEMFERILSGIISKHPNAEVEYVEVEYPDESEVTAVFSINEETLGFGQVKKEGNTFKSIWLVPVNKGFCETYINQFRSKTILK